MGSGWFYSPYRPRYLAALKAVQVAVIMVELFTLSPSMWKSLAVS